MQMIGNQYTNDDVKSKKIITISIIAIVVSLALIITLFVLNTYMKSKELKLYIDNVQVSNPEKFVVFDEATGEMYFPIEEMCKKLGYKYYRGEYLKHNEDQTECYIQSENEVAGFYQDSNKIYKINIQTNDSDFENYEIAYQVKSINGILYVPAEGLKIGMNTMSSYVADDNTVKLYSMNYLITAYATKVADYGYTSISPDYNNQKAVTDNLLVVEKDKKYGVITTDNASVIGTKYDSIEYLQNTKEFLVTDAKKVGILSNSRTS